MRIQTRDGLPAEVYVQDQFLGATGERLTFDASGYRRPLILDVVLKRKGYVPTLHTLEVPDSMALWEPAPLGLLRPVREVRLRTSPVADKLYVENDKGDEVPAGAEGRLSLEVDVPAFGAPAQASEVVVSAHAEGYVVTRFRLPPDVWFADVYPPPQQEALPLSAAGGWRAWWFRTTRESPVLLALSALGLVVLVAFLWLRFHYLRRIADAHQALQEWVARLNTFVESSRELAAPLTLESLASNATLQARRLCRAQWGILRVESFEVLHHGDQCPPEDAYAKIYQFVESKKHPIRLDRVRSSSFGELPSEYPSLLCQPLLYKGEYRGLILVGDSKEACFAPVDEEALGVLASQLAAALERIALHKETVDAYRKLAESEAQLIQAAKMSAVGQLAAGVAHELNTPLNAITFGVEMAQSNLENHPARAQKRLALVIAAAQKAAEIVKKLLYYSREARVDDREFTLEVLLTDTLDFLDFQLDRDGIEVRVDDHADYPLRGNLNELIQVLSNLILNARDSINGGDSEKTINISIRDRVASVEILVADRGPGIAEEAQEMIFTPFFTTKNQGEGTGLGLSISRTIMEKHSGELKLQSAKDPCCFSMKLPKSLTSGDRKLEVPQP
ncbi:MAG: GAF domain-containing sensor histidine kinase [Candidatus Eremiobacteraeota bacterium]|nr:GAF domain-containing sensor histidine kinase [Candidatus Eremiobacteraeota bacterium]